MDELEIAQFIYGPVDAKKHLRHSIMNIARRDFLDPEKFTAIIPVIVEQSQKNIRLALEDMRENPGSVFANGLRDELAQIFDYGQMEYQENGNLVIEGTVGDFAKKRFFPAICARFSHDLPMRCEVSSEGWRRNYNYGVLISVTDKDGKKHAHHWGSLTEKVRGDPLDLAKGVVKGMRNGDSYTLK